MDCACCNRHLLPGQSDLAERLQVIADGIVETVLRKNADYGDSYKQLRDEYGPDSFLIRLSDKLNRLKSLRGKEALVSESTTDTVRDIVGYCLLELAYREGDDD